jgi:hypothetical protein
LRADVDADGGVTLLLPLVVGCAICVVSIDGVNNPHLVSSMAMNCHPTADFKTQ